MNCCRTLKELEVQVGEKVIESVQSSSPNPHPSSKVIAIFLEKAKLWKI